jgi:hypothetical protein
MQNTEPRNVCNMQNQETHAKSRKNKVPLTTHPH